MVVFQIGIFILLAVLFVRMVNLQWLQHEGLMLQPEKIRLNLVPVLPTRGRLLD